MALPRIAVVDNEPTFLRLAQNILTDAGYEVLILNGGASAFEMIRRVQPQLLIVDTWLESREEGWDLLQLMRLSPETASIPIVVLSSDDKKLVKERFATTESGSDVTLLFKPFYSDQLLHAITRALERYHA